MAAFRFDSQIIAVNARRRLIEIMPYVNIKITDENATSEQKARLIRGVTELLSEVLDKNPATTIVVIDEVATDNWGINGDSVTVRRERETKK